ncbi:MAG TPA: hemolysin III family protein [Aeromonadales bacterium]|nr:hemolysin III family protein [Aeromonadales bacterium]
MHSNSSHRKTSSPSNSLSTEHFKEVVHQLGDKAQIQVHKVVEGAYSMAEEIVNSVTHGIGALLSIAALVLMVVLSVTQSSTIAVVASAIYGASLILLFLASTLYHGFQKSGVKKSLKVFDHCAIYLLIAGTYTPFMLISLQGAWGYTMTAVIWSLALFGVIFKIFYTEKFPRLSLFTYIFMGWLIVVASSEMVSKVPVGGLVLLAAGGLVYTLGTIFYASDKIPFNHAIWHGFVLGGATCHFFAVYLYVIPGA